MEVFEEYRKLYEKHIVKNAKLHIIKYDSLIHKYEYKPYSHTVIQDSMDKLSKLVIDNMVFYAFSEEEVVEQNKKFGLLDDLTVAAKYAYQQRLPHRKNANTDGTVGEVLLDILIQVFEPISQKLIARAKYRQQSDNNEIKGYDALYFTKNSNETSLWLGQVKTGGCKYCKSSIIDDLNNKYVLDYFCKSLFYIADKVDDSSDLSIILNGINKICFESIKNGWNDSKKMKFLINFLKDNKVIIKIPCLLAYTEDIYKDNSTLNINVLNSVNKMIKEFEKTDFQIVKGLEYQIMFCVFPLEDVKELRRKIVEFKKAGA